MAKQQPDSRCFDANGAPLAGAALLQRVREIGGDRLLFSFSMGKDSLAAWLWLRREAPDLELIPYFLYWCPGLSFVEKSLAYYERLFDRHIIRLPHPLFYKMFRSGAFQPPERMGKIMALDLPEFDYSDIDRLLAHDYNLPADFFCVVGMRAADNLQRLRLIQQMGALGFRKRHYYYPIWDWKIEQVAEIILAGDVALPADYWYWGRTLAAFDYQYLKPLAEVYPQDYERLLFWFPLLETEFFRYEMSNAS